MNNDLDQEIEKIRKSILHAIEDNELKEIFNDLIWGIIKYKQDDFGGALSNLGRFIEGAHEFLFNSLHSFTNIK